MGVSLGTPHTVAGALLPAPPWVWRADPLKRSIHGQANFTKEFWKNRLLPWTWYASPTLLVCRAQAANEIL